MPKPAIISYSRRRDPISLAPTRSSSRLLPKLYTETDYEGKHKHAIEGLALDLEYPSNYDWKSDLLKLQFTYGEASGRKQAPVTKAA